MDKSNNGEKLLLSVKETVELTGLSRNAVYGACHSGQLPTIRVGKRFWIPREALQKRLEENFTPATKE